MTVAVLFPPEIFVDHLLVAIRDARVRLPGSSLPYHQHARQAAALAVADDLSDELVAASLLSGIGEVILGSFSRHPAADHADLAALDAGRVAVDHLGVQFSGSVTRPIALLPRARRYLRAGGALGTTLGGDAMSAFERARFEAEPGAADAATVAVVEQRAGRTPMLCPPLDEYRGLLHGLCTDALVAVPRLRLIS